VNTLVAVHAWEQHRGLLGVASTKHIAIVYPNLTLTLTIV